MGSEKTGWGILGCGNIAKKFATGLGAVEDAKLVACGSRDPQKAEAFAAEFGVPRAHGSYEALVTDPDVDAIYVATPHVFHRDHSILCLEHGKHVLCEKPFTVNAGEARDVVEAARRNDCFLMEAMWTRFLPAIVALREVVASGRIGEVRLVQADFAFRCGWNPEGRLLNRELGGGGLLDVGVYTVSFASMLLGKPASVTGAAHIGETGVDEQAGLVLSYPGGGLALLACGVQTRTTHRAAVYGTEGYVLLDAFWHARELTVVPASGEPETLSPEFKGNGYNYQVEDVHRCLAEGRLESETMPLDESIAIMEIIDAARAQWGLVYPTEEVS